MATKICTKCKIERGIDNFCKNKNKKDGLDGSCKLCAKQYREKNKEHLRQYAINYRKENPEKVKQQNKDKYAKNSEYIKEYQKKYRRENPEKIKNLNCNYYKNNREKVERQKKEYIAQNKEKIKKYRRQYRKENKERINDNRKKYYENNLDFKIATNLRNRIGHALRSQKCSKNNKTINLVGCSLDKLKNYLESKFKEGMTWENHNMYGWHIDHIRPCKSFDLTDPEQQKECFHYTNLQPLWWWENLSKNDKWQNTT